MTFNLLPLTGDPKSRKTVGSCCIYFRLLVRGQATVNLIWPCEKKYIIKCVSRATQRWLGLKI